MKNELVHTIRGEVYTSSKIIAEMLSGSKDQHRNILKTIEFLLKNAEFQSRSDATVFIHESGSIFKETTFKNKMGRKYKAYDMNEQAYMFLAMQLGQYKNALEVQGLIIQSFMIMKQALMNKHNATFIEKRNQGKIARKDETDAIKEFVEYATNQGSKSASMYYQNITKMTNKALEILLQSKDGKPLRDLATVAELGFIQVVDNRASQAIQDGMNRKLPYKEIYKFAKTEVESIVDSLCFKRIR